MRRRAPDVNFFSLRAVTIAGQYLLAVEGGRLLKFGKQLVDLKGTST
jgi:hypothetical protein